jgi:hypothetical protein
MYMVWMKQKLYIVFSVMNAHKIRQQERPVRIWNILLNSILRKQEMNVKLVSTVTEYESNRRAAEEYRLSFLKLTSATPPEI